MSIYLRLSEDSPLWVGSLFDQNSDGLFDCFVPGSRKPNGERDEVLGGGVETGGGRHGGLDGAFEC